MIERLFASATLYSTLAMFFDFPQDALHPRLIARAIGRDVKCVLRQLRILEDCRILVGRSVGRQRIFRISDRYPLRREMEALFAKTRVCRCYPAQDGWSRTMDALLDETDLDGTGQ
jgi:hypothetical protein